MREFLILVKTVKDEAFFTREYESLAEFAARLKDSDKSFIRLIASFSGDSDPAEVYVSRDCIYKFQKVPRV